MTILIVGQATGSAERFREALRPVAEVVIVANDAQDALRMIRDRQDVRIVIADKEWPGADGPELLEGSEHRRVHFIQIAGRPTGIVWADDFVAEPVDLGELVARVKIARRLLDAQDELERVRGELQDQNDQLAELATTDGLTGLMNRRAFDTALDTEWLRAARSTKPLGLLMIDVDNFKAYNDLYGHQGGDECLRTVGRSLSVLARRPGDIVARYGGEEFVVLLPETDEDGAFFIAEAIRQGVRDLAIPHDGTKKKVVTVSIGVASSLGSTNLGASADLLARADKALYLAKSAGRDKVTGWRNTGSFESRREAY